MPQVSCTSCPFHVWVKICMIETKARGETVINFCCWKSRFMSAEKLAEFWYHFLNRHRLKPMFACLLSTACLSTGNNQTRGSTSMGLSPLTPSYHTPQLMPYVSYPEYIVIFLFHKGNILMNVSFLTLLPEVACLGLWADLLSSVLIQPLNGYNFSQVQNPLNYLPTT